MCDCVCAEDTETKTHALRVVRQTPSGTGTEYRAEILNELTAQGINVTWPTATWDKDLEAIVARSRIVLNVRSFNLNDEFKMSRFMVLLANQA